MYCRFLIGLLLVVFQLALCDCAPGREYHYGKNFAVVLFQISDQKYTLYCYLTESGLATESSCRRLLYVSFRLDLRRETMEYAP